MGALAQTVPPFKVETTEELLTANTGLIRFGEYNRGLGLERWLGQEVPPPGSTRGFAASAYVSPLVLMLAGGGRSASRSADHQSRHSAWLTAQA